MSKELEEAIDWLKNKCYVESPQDEKFDSCIAIIEQALLKAQKELKALEIIKEKECDVRWLKYCIKGNAKVETYNNGLPEYYEKLTEEEFNLLKEVLE